MINCISDFINKSHNNLLSKGCYKEFSHFGWQHIHPTSLHSSGLVVTPS
nr:MAG TPA: hypothetical protein [Caudoviricetes sp.]